MPDSAENKPSASARVRGTVHQAIARALIDNGVTTMFGLIGDANLYMVDSYVRDFGGGYVAGANEAGVTLMALGHASVTGQVGVATITHGPALTNTLTALVEGVKARLPIVLLCGDTDPEAKHHLQNIPQRELIADTGAGFEQLRTPATLSTDVATAFRRARIERRPIVLNMPYEFQWLEVDYQPVTLRTPQARAAAAPGPDLDDAIGILAGAKRPILLAGRGAASPEARAAILRLAERTGAPVATTLRAKGLFAGEPYNLGIFGTLSTPVAVDAILESDCVVAFGASLSFFTSSHGSFAKGRRIVQVNLDPADIGCQTEPDVGVVGDAAEVADAMVYWLDQAEVAPSGYRSEALREQIAAYRPEPLPPRADDGVCIQTALQRINAVLPSDRVLVTDGGRFLGHAWKLIDVEAPSRFVPTTHFGSIGLGLGEAIGAAMAAGAPTVLVAGDGGFMLGGFSEFSTAVRYGTDLIVILCNDGSYGAEHIQFMTKGMDPTLSLMAWPDFAPIAVAFGGEGVIVRTNADIDLAVAAIAARRKPLLIELKLDPHHMPRAY